MVGFCGTLCTTTLFTSAVGYIIGGITRKWGNNIVFIHPGCSFGELQSKLGFGVDQKHFFLDGVIIIFLVKKKKDKIWILQAAVNIWHLRWFTYFVENIDFFGASLIPIL